MALDPIVTEVTPASFTVAAYLTALHSHFSTTSTKFQVDCTGTGGVTDGFTISSLTDTGWQINFRGNSTGAPPDIKISIEPAGTITDSGTDAGTGPTGTTSDWSSERIWTCTTGMTSGAKVWLVELDDAIFIMNLSSTGTTWQNSVHAGKVYNPHFPSVDIAAGRDGLGIMCQGPTESSLQEWLGDTTGNYNAVHVATGIWDVINPDNTPINTGADNPTYVGYLRPYPYVIVIGSTAGYAPIGFSRYIMQTGISYVPVTRVDLNNTTNEAWIYGGLVGSTSAYKLIIPWRRGVVP